MFFTLRKKCSLEGSLRNQNCFVFLWRRCESHWNIYFQ